MLAVIGMHALNLAIYTEFAKLKTSPKFPAIQYFVVNDNITFICIPLRQAVVTLCTRPFLGS